MSLRCPYCLGGLELEASGVVRCTACFTPHHAACFREHGRCTQLGCESTETTRDRAAEIGFGWDLHPFLPTQSHDQQARFLSLRTSVDASASVTSQLRLRLQVADQVRCGQLLSGNLRVFAPQAVHGRGLRLTCRLVVALDDPPLYTASAVFLGSPPISWLEALKLKARGEQLLLAAGRTEFEFRFDPSPLPRRQRLPDHPQFGVYHSLEVVARLESHSLPWESRAQRVIVQHRPGRCGHRRPRDPWPDARLR
ncbi:MAG: hypothetical protein JKY65_31550 [Planctomycetes bacterium]|nr:hypothetical protein [Planctomycetota bacterium]